jgi:hypothetical protein
MDSVSRPADTDLEDVEGDEVDMTEAIDIDALVTLYRSWWFWGGSQRIMAIDLTTPLEKLGLITGTTLMERDRRSRELLPELVGHTIDIFRVEPAGHIEFDGESEPCYRLVVVEGETPPLTHAQLEASKKAE